MSIDAQMTLEKPVNWAISDYKKTNFMDFIRI